MRGQILLIASVEKEQPQCRQHRVPPLRKAQGRLLQRTQGWGNLGRNGARCFIAVDYPYGLVVIRRKAGPSTSPTDSLRASVGCAQDDTVAEGRLRSSRLYRSAEALRHPKLRKSGVGNACWVCVDKDDPSQCRQLRVPAFRHAHGRLVQKRKDGVTLGWNGAGWHRCAEALPT